jgi:hypothetical protein
VHQLRISDITKDIFYEEVGHVFDQFLKYYMKMLLGDFNARYVENIYFQTNNWGIRIYLKLVMIMGLK